MEANGGRPAVGLRLWLVLAFGFGASLAATVALRATDGLAAGWLLICGPNAVPSPDFPGALMTFMVEPIPLFLLATAAVVYLALFRRIRKTKHARLFPKVRAVCFLSGIGFVTLMVFGPLAAYDHTFLSVHMIQHFLLITIAPPLILAGAPLTLLLTSVSKETRKQWLYPVLHSKPFHAFTFPLVGLVLFALIPTMYYVTPLFEWSLENDLLHYVGYSVFLFAGLHYWWPVVPLNPTRWHMPFPVQLVYLLALVPIHAFLGLLFYEPTQVMYPALSEAPRTWGPSPLLDQQFAGAFMFVAGEALGLVALLIVAMQWARHDEALGRRLDRELARKKAMRAAQEGEVR